MTEFRALVDGTPGHLITKDGTFVITRVYFVEGVFNLGDGPGRTLVVGEKTLNATFTPGHGLMVRTTNYHIWLPAECLRASWKTPSGHSWS